jgi:hypothetical protein
MGVLVAFQVPGKRITFEGRVEHRKGILHKCTEFFLCWNWKIDSVAFGWLVFSRFLG